MEGPSPIASSAQFGPGFSSGFNPFKSIGTALNANKISHAIKSYGIAKANVTMYNAGQLWKAEQHAKATGEPLVRPAELSVRGLASVAGRQVRRTVFGNAAHIATGGAFGSPHNAAGPLTAAHLTPEEIKQRATTQGRLDRHEDLRRKYSGEPSLAQEAANKEARSRIIIAPAGHVPQGGRPPGGGRPR